jgi:hypothetical protein
VHLLDSSIVKTEISIDKGVASMDLCELFLGVLVHALSELHFFQFDCLEVFGGLEWEVLDFFVQESLGE